VYAELASMAWLSPWIRVDDAADPAALAARILR
jgi:hypothetical protein